MKRNIEKEMRNYNSKYDHTRVAGVAYSDFVVEMVKMISTPGFLPPCANYGKGYFPDADQSLEFIGVLDVCAFAALNVVRKANGLEPLYDDPSI